MAELEYGAAGTFTLLNEHLGLHANLAGLQREEGLTALRYRLGVSFVAWSDAFMLLRLYAYGDAIEFEGSAQSDMDLEVGAQALLAEFLTLELGVSLRLLDAGFIDDTLKRELRNQQGVFDRHFDDDGTWSVQLGVGFLF